MNQQLITRTTPNQKQQQSESNKLTLAELKSWNSRIEWVNPRNFFKKVKNQVGMSNQMMQFLSSLNYDELKNKAKELQSFLVNYHCLDGETDKDSMLIANLLFEKFKNLDQIHTLLNLESSDKFDKLGGNLLSKFNLPQEFQHTTLTPGLIGKIIQKIDGYNGIQTFLTSIDQFQKASVMATQELLLLNLKIKYPAIFTKTNNLASSKMKNSEIEPTNFDHMKKSQPFELDTTTKENILLTEEEIASRVERVLDKLSDGFFELLEIDKVRNTLTFFLKAIHKSDKSKEAMSNFYKNLHDIDITCIDFDDHFRAIADEKIGNKIITKAELTYNSFQITKAILCPEMLCPYGYGKKYKIKASTLKKLESGEDLPIQHSLHYIINSVIICELIQNPNKYNELLSSYKMNTSRGFSYLSTTNGLQQQSLTKEQSVLKKTNEITNRIFLKLDLKHVQLSSSETELLNRYKSAFSFFLANFESENWNDKPDFLENRKIVNQTEKVMMTYVGKHKMNNQKNIQESGRIASILLRDTGLNYYELMKIASDDNIMKAMNDGELYDDRIALVTSLGSIILITLLKHI